MAEAEEALGGVAVVQTESVVEQHLRVVRKCDGRSEVVVCGVTVCRANIGKI